MTDYLIDISAWQGVKGGQAAIADPHVLGGYGKGTQGAGIHLFRDPDYHAFYDYAKQHHKPFGPYLFLVPDQDPRAQARDLLAYTRPVAGDMEPVVDSETWSSRGVKATAEATYAALDELRLHNFRPILYGSSSFLARLVAGDSRLKEFGVWYADYASRLWRVPGLRAVLWQFTDRMVVARGRLRVDGDRLMIRSLDELRIPKGKVVKHPAKPVPAKKRKPVSPHHLTLHGTTTTSTTGTSVTYTVHDPTAPKPKPAPKKAAAPKAKPKPAAKKPAAKPAPKKTDAKPPVKKKPATKKKPNAGGGTAKAA